LQEAAAAAGATTQLYADFNVYRNMLAKLQAPADFELIYSGLVRLLNNIPTSDLTYLPGALHQIKCVPVCNCGRRVVHVNIAYFSYAGAPCPVLEAPGGESGFPILRH
jgi:hypothetical protein